MKKTALLLALFTLAQGLNAFAADTPRKVDGYKDTVLLPGGKWHVHDPDRPQPVVVTPADEIGKPPSDAIILFDGTDTSKWRSGKEPAKWKVENGAMVSGSGYLTTADQFGDIQLHVEFATPEKVEGKSQGRGNSGVFLMGKFEFQVLDSFNNPTYPDGQAAALYGQHPPLVNASRPPGQWQAYDIVFTVPTFDKEGNLVTPAFVTAFHNGVLVQNHQAYFGPTGHRMDPHYTKMDATGPIALQDHHNPIHFRNIWVRPLRLDAEE